MPGAITQYRARSLGCQGPPGSIYWVYKLDEICPYTGLVQLLLEDLRLREGTAQATAGPSQPDRAGVRHEAVFVGVSVHWTKLTCMVHGLGLGHGLSHSHRDRHGMIMVMVMVMDMVVNSHPDPYHDLR